MGEGVNALYRLQITLPRARGSNGSIELRFKVRCGATTGRGWTDATKHRVLMESCYLEEEIMAALTVSYCLVSYRLKLPDTPDALLSLVGLRLSG